MTETTTTTGPTPVPTRPTPPDLRLKVIEDPDYTPDGCDGKPLPEAPEVYAESPQYDTTTEPHRL